MKKLIVVLAGVGAVIALRSVARQKMQQHCMQMASRCKQMMAGQSGEHGQPAAMPEHCKEMMAAQPGDGERAETREHAEEEARQFAGNGGAVETACVPAPPPPRPEDWATAT